MMEAGYSGLSTYRLSELVHGSQTPHCRPQHAYQAPPPNVLDVAGVSSVKLNTRVFTSCPKQTTKAGNNSFQVARVMIEPKGNVAHPVADDAAQSSHKHRIHRMATIDDCEAGFTRAFVKLDRRNGRTEIMTSRRPGYAHLDVNPVEFDVYKCHRREVPNMQHQSNLKAGLVPKQGSEIVPKKTKQLTCYSTINNEDHIGNNGEYMAPMPNKDLCEDGALDPNLSFHRRRILAPWSRSQMVGEVFAGIDNNKEFDSRVGHCPPPDIIKKYPPTTIRELARQQILREKNGVDPNCIPAGLTSFPRVKLILSGGNTGVPNAIGFIPAADGGDMSFCKMLREGPTSPNESTTRARRAEWADQEDEYGSGEGSGAAERHGDGAAERHVSTAARRRSESASSEFNDDGSYERHTSNETASRHTSNETGIE
eukprot:Selendium_serpulae@DN765_c0_g1_i1.p1